MANVLGIDVSKWNGVMDFGKARQAGARFCYIRAGSIDNVTGKCYEDSQFHRNKVEAVKHMPVGYYWYFRPNHDPVKQANYFADLMKGLDWDLPPVMDVEADGGLLPAIVQARLKVGVNALRVRVLVHPMVYTRGAWWNENVASDPAFGALDLWIARYTTLSKPWGNPYDTANLKPRDWSSWRVWQWSADGNGRGVEFGAPPPPLADESMDLNYFNGDEAALYAWIGWPQPVTLEQRVSRLEAEARAHGWAV